MRLEAAQDHGLTDDAGRNLSPRRLEVLYRSCCRLFFEIGQIRQVHLFRPEAHLAAQPGLDPQQHEARPRGLGQASGRPERRFG